MRIALVIAGRFPALRGSQVLVRQLAGGLRRRGHHVHLVSYGARVMERPGPSLARVARDSALVARLWRTVRKHAVDVIHAHNYEAALAGLVVGRLTGRPLVYHGHTALAEELPTYFGPRPMRALVGRLGRFLDAQIPRRAHFCIAVTEELADVLRGAGVPPEELAWIAPTGSPRELETVPAPPRDSGLVCYAGNLDGYQNLHFLLRSFARVRDEVPGARLVLVTHTDPVRALEPPPEGVEVVVAPAYAQVRERLDAADVAVCPRVARSGFPMKLLNYMAAGKAIVASAGSAKGLVDGVTGRVVPDGDEAAFARAVVALLRDRATRRRLGAAAREAVASPRAWEGVLDRIEGIYRRVRRQPSGAAPAPAPVVAR